MMKDSWGTGELNQIFEKAPFLMRYFTGPTFYFFASFMVVGTIFVFVKVPETKGKSNAQIQAILAGKN
jgi:Sugar (and other) transporter